MAKITATLAGNITPFATAMAKAQGIAGRTASNISSRLKSFVTSPLGQAGAAISGFFTYQTFADGIKGAIDSGAQLQKLHNQTGMNIEGLATLGAAFRMADVDSSLLTVGVSRMQNALFKAGNGNKQAAAAFGVLRIPIEQLRQARPDQQFNAIGRAIARIEDPTVRAGAAMAIFGRSGAQLLPAFEVMAGQDIGKIGEKAKILAQNSERFQAITIGFRKAGTNLKNLFIGMAVGLAPAFEKVSGFLANIDLIGVGQSLGKGLSSAVPIVGGLLMVAAKLGGILRAAWTGLLGVLSNPVAALGTLGASINLALANAGNLFLAALKYPIDYVRNFFSALGTDAFPTLGGILYNSLGLAAAHFNELLINAGLDFLTTMSAIPALAGAANAGIDSLIKSKSATLVDAAKYGAGLNDSTGKFGAAISSANKNTKFQVSDVFGSGYWGDQLKRNSGSLMASGKGQEKLIGGYYAGIFNGKFGSDGNKPKAPWQPKTGLEKSWVGLFGRPEAEKMSLARSDANNLDPSSGWTPSTSAQRQRVSLIGRRAAWEAMTPEGQASIASGGKSTDASGGKNDVMSQMLQVLKDMSGTMDEAWEN